MWSSVRVTTSFHAMVVRFGELHHREVERLGVRKLLLLAPTPKAVIELLEDRAHDVVDDAARELLLLALFLSFVAPLDGDALGDLLAVALVVFVDLGQELEQFVRAQEVLTGDEVAFGSQHCDGRPAAHVVAAVEVRPPIRIDPNRHVMRRHVVDDPLIRKGRALHLLAVAAPVRDEEEQDRPLLFACLAKMSLIPIVPLQRGHACVLSWCSLSACGGPENPERVRPRRVGGSIASGPIQESAESPEIARDPGS
jgi:hypothetical protein